MSANICIKYFQAIGKVQNVMFRQTIIRGAISRGLKAGATNDKINHSLVYITFKGNPQKIEEITDFLRAGKLMNDWGAKTESLEEMNNGYHYSQHEVNTDNVDKFKWKLVKMYL